MLPNAKRVRDELGRLVAGFTELRHDGRFHEPNLDGTPGDYVSFDSWEWPQGVGLYGLVRLWQQSRDSELQRTIEGWYDRRIAEGLPAMNVNTSAPMLALSVLWRETRDPRWREPLEDWAERMMHAMPRTVEGGFQHNVSDKINDNELWDDTLFMAALFLASFGEGAGKAEYVTEALRQFLVHARYLADPRTGLWFHGWTFDGRHNFARAYWARGNSWATISILDLFELARVGEPLRGYLAGILEAQLSALLKLQTKSGGWRTLLNDEASYVEMSATAGFGYSFMKAARLGIGPRGCREAGMAALGAVLANIDADGVLQNVSYGTRMGADLQFYRDIPLHPTGYGQALAILCLAEGLRNLGEEVRAA